MTWPTGAANTTNTDDDTDIPSESRANDILTAIQKLNQIIAHVSAFVVTLLDDADDAAVRATLGLGINSITDSMIQALGRFSLHTSDGTFVAPKAGNYLVVCLGGGGGGGGGGNTSAVANSVANSGQGGSGGDLAIAVVTLSASQNVAVTVGAAGAGNTAGLDGTDGGDTTFGALLIAIGGSGGKAGANYLGAFTGAAVSPPGGTGGGNGGGQGGQGANANLNGNAGSNGSGKGSGGGGGSGASTITSTARSGGTGGNGVNGLCMVIW